MVTASPSNTTRRNWSTEKAGQEASAFGAWKVTRPVFACSPQCRPVMSLKPATTFGFRRIVSQSRWGRTRAQPQPPWMASTAFTEGSAKKRLTSAARSSSFPAR